MWIPSICKPQRWKKIFNWGPLRMKPSCGGVHSHHTNFKQDWKSVFKCCYLLIFVSEEADLYCMSILNSFSDLPCYAWSMSPDLPRSCLYCQFIRSLFSKKRILEQQKASVRLPLFVKLQKSSFILQVSVLCLNLHLLMNEYEIWVLVIFLHALNFHFNFKLLFHTSLQ